MNLNLKSIRKQHNLTQAQVAERLGITRAAYTNIENHRRGVDSEMLIRLADVFDCTMDELLPPKSRKGVNIPVLGCVRAGVPIEAVEDILDYEEIAPELASTGEFFALRVTGDSMEPRFADGDVVIVRKQSDVDSGAIAIVLTNGDDATIKKVVKHPDGISLVASNPKYDPLYFNNIDIAKLPVIILGKVVELRAKF